MDSILHQIRQGLLPEHAQGAVVSGIMPLEPEELIEAVFHICFRNPTHLNTARETIEALPTGVKKSFFEAKNAAPEMIGFFLSSFTLEAPVMSVILLNSATPAAAILEIADRIPAELLDQVVNNQVKILEEPAIVEGLRLNPGLSINQKQKLEDYERLLLKPLVSDAAELENKSLEEIEKEAIAEAREFVSTFGKEKESTPAGAETRPLTRSPAKSEEKSGEKEGSGEKVSVLEQLSSMSIPQKIQAAIKGDREVRGILIRESNKLVCTSVIKSPRITESEVEFYANLRNVQTDVLRLIAQHREWTKNYKIVTNLVRNPRTPLTFTMRLMHRLNKRDIRNLVRDRGVPEALRTMARKIMREEKS